jgi:hypothetical protein
VKTILESIKTCLTDLQNVPKICKFATYIWWSFPRPMASQNTEKSYLDIQPEITIINLNSETNPTLFRCNHNNTSPPSTLVKLAHPLEPEDALIVNLLFSPNCLCVVTTLKDKWVGRFQMAVQEDWEHVQQDASTRTSVEHVSDLQSNVRLQSTKNFLLIGWN